MKQCCLPITPYISVLFPAQNPGFSRNDIPTRADILTPTKSSLPFGKTLQTGGDVRQENLQGTWDVLAQRYTVASQFLAGAITSRFFFYILSWRFCCMVTSTTWHDGSLAAEVADHENASQVRC